ncbi:MAG: TraB/VirB10 family protein [Proteobacteria bacterium]|nr:TraB/VirB10 family protein [Pseudomonadota bacterium]
MANAGRVSIVMSRWAALSPTVRSILAVIALMAVVMGGIVAVGGVSIEPTENRSGPHLPNATSNLRMNAPTGDGTEKLVGRVDAAQSQILELRRQIEQQGKDAKSTQAALMLELEKARADGGGVGRGVSSDLIEEVRKLAGELKELKTNPKLASNAPSPDELLPAGAGGPSSEHAVPVPEPPKRPTLKSFGGKPVDEGSRDPRSAKPGKELLVSLPAGSMFEVVLLNGAMAPTNSVARRNPVPLMLRVKTEAILPGRQTSQDIKECLLLVSGYGELSSERLLARSEVMSCAFEDGRMAEAKIEGYLVGEDGVLGMQGELISRQGQRIAQALTAGTLGGIAKGLTPYQVPQVNLSGGSSSSVSALPGLDQVLQAGIAGGVGDTAKMVSQFYLDSAKEAFPVLRVPSMRKATIILTKGFELRI